MRPREIGFVLLGHCQNLLDDPRNLYIHESENSDFQTFAALYTLYKLVEKSIARETYEINSQAT